MTSIDGKNCDDYEMKNVEESLNYCVLKYFLFRLFKYLYK